MSSRVTRGIRGDVAAVFPDRAAARQAAEELCAQGADAHLREALAVSERRVFELDLGQVVRRGATRGALIGSPLGAVVGALLVASALSGTGLSAPEAVLAGGLPGLVAGLVFGAFAGLVRALWVFEDIDQWMAVPVGEDEVLVIARDHGDRRAVRRALERHGGRPVGGLSPPRSGGQDWRHRIPAMGPSRPRAT